MIKLDELVITCVDGMKIKYNDVTVVYSDDRSQMFVRGKDGSLDTYIISNIIRYHCVEKQSKEEKTR